MKNIQTLLSVLPTKPGVYQMLDERGEVIYIGKARHLKKRVSSYFSGSQKDPKTEALLDHIHDIQVIVTHSENEALLLESNLIKKYKPHYNILFRDDKSYPYILMTDHAFPQITIYRGPKKSGGHYFGPYPNASAVHETIHLLERLFSLRTCADTFYAKRRRPCLLHQIGRCSGPCVGLISKEAYQQQVHRAELFLMGKNNQIIDELEKEMEHASSQREYELAAHFRDQISQLRSIQERQYVSASTGDADIIAIAREAGMICIQLSMIRQGRLLGSQAFFPKVPQSSTDEEIITAFITQHYLNPTAAHDIPKEILLPKDIADRQWFANALTEAAHSKIRLHVTVRGDRKKWLDSATLNAKQALINQLTQKANLLERFKQLRDALMLDTLPKRIECFDVSHTQGEETVGSCVVFNQEGALKSDYRRYNIKGVTQGDDARAMSQMLNRRFQHSQQEKSHLPDIILIDGGKTQLRFAGDALHALGINTIFLIGVAKGEGRKPGLETLYFEDRPPLHLSSDSLALHLIQQIRDEAHRFAVSGHRLRRDKKRRTSLLESIPGIGAKRRRELLRYFGGIQGLKRASLEEIEKVPGINKALAERVFELMH